MRTCILAMLRMQASFSKDGMFLADCIHKNKFLNSASLQVTCSLRVRECPSAGISVPVCWLVGCLFFMVAVFTSFCPVL